MSSPKTYTADDIARYQRGEMTPAEMHALEKAALDDPMLADALEGYSYTTSAAPDLQVLQNRLQQRLLEKEQQKTFLLYNPLFRIAALFVLIAGAGWLVWQTFTTGNSDVARAGDKALEQQENALAADTLQSAPMFREDLQTDSLQRNNVVTASRRKATEKQVADATSSSTAAAPQPEKETGTANTAINTLTSDAFKNKAATTDVVVLRKEAPPGVMQQRGDSVTSSELSEERASTNREVDARSRNNRLLRTTVAVPDPATPQGGWQLFQKYIADNRRPVDTAAISNKANTDVEISFDIDNDGRPINMKITDSLCKLCDAEAVRLLREGPGWEGPARKGKVKIKIID